jgi:hypothetical protein
VTQAGLLTVFVALGWMPAVAASSLERRIEARIQNAFARYDILSRQELECSTLVVSVQGCGGESSAGGVAIGACG